MAAVRNLTANLSIVKTFQIMPIDPLLKLYIDIFSLYKLHIETTDPLLSHRRNIGIFDVPFFFLFYLVLGSGI